MCIINLSKILGIFISALDCFYTFCEESHWDFEWEYIESVDFFHWAGHFHNIKSIGL